VKMSVKQLHEECEALDRFRHASGELAGTVSRGANPPDFIIEDDGRRITVEMTRYHQDAGGPRGSALALQESAERSLRALAQQSFERLHPGLYVSISPFFREGVLTRANVRRYAESLASLVAELVPPAPTESHQMTSRDAMWQELQAAGLGHAIVQLRVWRHINMREGDWRVHPGGHPSRDTGHLLSRIQAKEHDLARYRRPGDESWLIVYAPILQASGFFDFGVLQPRMFESMFHTVVFIDVVWRHFVKVEARAAR
jgi:hypothetical protein